jgi:hypothetical protein
MIFLSGISRSFDAGGVMTALERAERRDYRAGLAGRALAKPTPMGRIPFVPTVLPMLSE